MRKILMLLLTAAMCLTACGKDAPLPEVPVEPEAPPAAAAPEPARLPALRRGEVHLLAAQSPALVGLA